MINSTDLQTIKETTQDFFKKMAILAEVEVKNPQDLTIPIDLKTEEPQILIGEKGQTLAEIQHLLKAILKKKINQSFFIDLDVNDYKKKKKEYLKELARMAADEVVLSKNAKQLTSMPAYERRIIHLELAARSDVSTESIGREPHRKVMIKPYP